MISAPLLEAILNYLTTRPYREVSGFIKAAQQEIDVVDDFIDIEVDDEAVA
mgnify:CR=1 FL=1